MNDIPKGNRVGGQGKGHLNAGQQQLLSAGKNEGQQKSIFLLKSLYSLQQIFRENKTKSNLQHSPKCFLLRLKAFNASAKQKAIPKEISYILTVYICLSNVFNYMFWGIIRKTCNMFKYSLFYSSVSKTCFIFK